MGRSSDALASDQMASESNQLLDLVSEIHRLTSELADRARTETRVQRFRTYPEFYRALNSAVLSAESSLRLTHIREHPPSAFRMENSYFSDVEKWALDHPECSVQRVIALNNPAMAQWAESLVETEKNVPNFHARACEWAAAFPMINMAILDEAEVYLALSGENPERTAGLVMIDREVGRYFVDYYENLWHNSLALEKALEAFEDRHKPPP